MASPHQERQQLEDDIERIKSTLRSSNWDISLGQGVGDSDSDDGTSVASLQTSSTNWQAHHANDSQVDRKDFKKELKTEEDDENNQELLQMSLALNKAYQEIITEDLELIRLMIAQNREHQEDLEQRINDDMSDRGAKAQKAKKRHPTNYGYPFFRDKNGLPPPRNYDAECKKNCDEPEVYARPARTWFTREKKLLEEAVITDLLKQTLQPIMNRKELDLGHLSEAKDNFETEIADVLRERIAQHDAEINDIMSKRDQLPMITDNYMDKIDWLAISIQEFGGSRTADECHVFWKNYLQPRINTSRWKSEEDSLLQEAVEAHGGRDWSAIAQTVGNGRSAFQCLQRFQKKLNPCLKTGKWSAEEDKFLKEVVTSVQVGQHIPWDEVAYYMEGRSNEQCEERWLSLQNEGKFGRWTIEEDKLLLDAFQRYGREWMKVSEHVPQRSAPQCRERYLNTLALDTRFGFWRYQEDRTLWLFYKEHGETGWCRICQDIPGRTDNACMQRLKVLQRFKKIEDILLQLPDGVSIVERLLKVCTLRNRKKCEPGTVRKFRIQALKRHLSNATSRVIMLKKQQELMVRGRGNSRNAVYYEAQIEAAVNQQKSFKQLLTQEESRIPINKNYALIEVEEQQFDIEQSLKDRANGVYVPRPLLGFRGVNQKMFEPGSYRKLVSLIKTKVQVLLESVPATFKKAKLEVKTEENCEKTVKVVEPDHDAKTSKKRRGRPPLPKNPKEIAVDMNIMKLIEDSRLATARYWGRPLKTEKSEEEETTQDNIVEKKVFKIIVSALNVDVDGAVNKSKQILENVTFDLKNLKSRNLHSNLSFLEAALNKKLGTPKYATSAQTKASAVGSNISIQTLPRRQLQGPNASRAYHLPTLPPAVSTIHAFKSLLLNRKELVSVYSRGLKRLATESESSSAPAKKHKSSQLYTSLISGTAQSKFTVNLNLSSQNFVSSSSETKSSTLSHISSKSAKKSDDSSVTAAVTAMSSSHPVISPTTPRLNESSAVNPGLSVSSCNNTTAAGRSLDKTSVVTTGTTSQANPKLEVASKTLNNSSGGQGVNPAPIRLNIPPGCEMSLENIKKLLQARGLISKSTKLKMKVLGRSTDQATTSRSSVGSDKNLSKSPTKFRPKNLLHTIRQTHDYKILYARFKSLFLWPAFLSTTPMEPPMETTAQPSAAANELSLSDNRSGNEHSSSDHPVILPQASRVITDNGTPNNKQETIPSTTVSSYMNKMSHEQVSASVSPGVVAGDDCLIVKKKKQKYPCTKGKRFRRQIIKPREIQQQKIHNYRMGRLHGAATTNNQQKSKKPTGTESMPARKSSRLERKTDNSQIFAEHQTGDVDVDADQDLAPVNSSLVEDLPTAAICDITYDISTNANTTRTASTNISAEGTEADAATHIYIKTNTKYTCTKIDTEDTCTKTDNGNACTKPDDEPNLCHENHRTPSGQNSISQSRRSLFNEESQQLLHKYQTSHSNTSTSTTTGNLVWSGNENSVEMTSFIYPNTEMPTDFDKNVTFEVIGAEEDI